MMKNFEMPSFKKFSFCQFETISASNVLEPEIEIGMGYASDPNFFDDCE